jgi:hypothetical protein
VQAWYDIILNRPLTSISTTFNILTNDASLQWGRSARQQLPLSSRPCRLRDDEVRSVRTLKISVLLSTALWGCPRGNNLIKCLWFIVNQFPRLPARLFHGFPASVFWSLKQKTVPRRPEISRLRRYLLTCTVVARSKWRCIYDFIMSFFQECFLDGLGIISQCVKKWVATNFILFTDVQSQLGDFTKFNLTSVIRTPSN